MYLKRLEIRGFKSFADHTEINLNPGVNIIVGPNGCGKSNIVDSIRWVLGETNIRNLRGLNSEDVIFNGTDNKKALSLALVNISIDNHDHILPVDYDEVVVGRKVYRSGESEFYLNKTRVRMKDIASLFTGTGLGKKGYSIISQGELEQVLNGQAFERRLILEEASGIIRYRQQRDEVNRRIIATSNDLERAGDILAELQTRREELSIKAEKARTHVSLAEECDRLEKQVMMFEYYRLQKDLQSKMEELSDKKAVCADVDQDIKKRQNTLSGARKELNQERQGLQDLKENKYETNARLNTMRGDYKICEEKIRNWKERIESCTRDENKYQSLLEKINKDLGLVVNDLEREEQSYAERFQQVQELQTELEAMSQQGNSDRQAFEELACQIAKRNEQKTDMDQAVQALEQDIKTNQEKKERIQIHLEEVSGRIETLNHTIAQLTGDQNRGVKEAGSAEAVLQSTEKQKNQLEVALKKLNDEYQADSREIMNINNRLALIRSQEKNYTGYSEAVRLLMQSTRNRENRLTGIVGVLGELIDVPAGLELAIETAAGRGLENIVVESGRQAQNAIEYLKKQKWGRITFLPLDLLKVQTVPQQISQEMKTTEGVVGIASQLVKFDQRYRKAVEYMLGRVLVVTDLDRSLLLYKKIKYPFRLVTLEGDTINVSGAMAGGNNKNRGISPLKLKNEEKDLQQKLADKQQQMKDNRSREAALTEELQQVVLAYNEGHENLARLRFQNEMLQQQIAQLSGELIKAEAEKEQHERDMEKVQTLLKQLKAGLAETQARYHQWLQENTSFNERMEKQKANLEVYKREYEVKKERLNSYQDQLNLKKRELDNIHKNIDQLEQIKKSYLETLEQAAAMKTQLTTDIGQQTERLQTINNEMVIMQQQIASLQTNIEAAQQREKDYLEQITVLQQGLDNPTEKLDSLRNNIRNLEISIARAETELTGYIGRWQERFNSEIPSEDPGTSSGREIRENKHRITILHEQIEELGVVDPGSIKEYEEVNERCDFLDKQFNDLTEARISLTTLLEETEKLMVQEFQQFMVLANQSFNKTFQEIFGGGEARLSLDKGNAFEAGIEINVKMPGKRNQSLNLLSGGERALTCIAFIFALLRLRPAPFCLLDEIDAALDEINLVRFSKFLQDMAREIQFIVITHRQVTIQAGENVYGVTMPEEGISAVLSINLGKEETMAG